MEFSLIILGTCALLLLISNILQFRFWAKQNQALVDKLMSRNYAEYVQANSPVTKPLQFDPIISDDEVLRELNQQVLA